MNVAERSCVQALTNSSYDRSDPNGSAYAGSEVWVANSTLVTAIFSQKGRELIAREFDGLPGPPAKIVDLAALGSQGRGDRRPALEWL